MAEDVGGELVFFKLSFFNTGINKNYKLIVKREAGNIVR